MIPQQLRTIAAGELPQRHPRPAAPGSEPQAAGRSRRPSRVLPAAQGDGGHIPAGPGSQWLRDREVLAAICRFPEGVVPRCIPPLVSRSGDVGASLDRLEKVGLIEQPQGSEAVYATRRGLEVIREIDPLNRDVIDAMEAVA